MHDAAVTHVFKTLMRVAVTPVPGDVRGQRLAGVEPDVGQTELARTLLREGQHAVADAALLRGGRSRNAPDQEIVSSRLKDQHAIERAVALREINLVVR